MVVVVVVLMGDRVRLGLVGGKTVPPPPPHVGFLLAEASSPRPPNTREKKPLVAGNPPRGPDLSPTM